jgi:mycothione reductase
MKDYDILVIGSGSGSIIVEMALKHGLKVALVDKGPLGGTCLNVGCIPSKMIIFPADLIAEIRQARKLGIEAQITSIDFAGIMKRTRQYVQHERQEIRKSLEGVTQLDFYEDTGTFVDDYIMEVGDEKIRAKKVYLASGARPYVPLVKGIEKVDYLTNNSVFELQQKPESLIVIGGGYVAVEFSHFFAAMGTKVTILQRAERLLKDEEPEVSALLEKEMRKRLTVETNSEAQEILRTGEGGFKVIATDRTSGQKKEYTAKKVLIAAGRQSNADLLQVEKTGIRTDEKGYILVNEYLETSKPNIWAFGDAIGKQMYRHAANHEAELVWHNSAHGGRDPVDFQKIPHAVFSFPQIGAVGLREDEAKKTHDILVGKAAYSEVAQGQAMREEDAFVKIIVEKKTGKILGCHIIGPSASILIQEVVNAMTTGETVFPIFSGIHIHPALSEVVHSAVGNLEEPS